MVQPNRKIRQNANLASAWKCRSLLKSEQTDLNRVRARQRNLRLDDRDDTTGKANATAEPQSASDHKPSKTVIFLLSGEDRFEVNSSQIPQTIRNDDTLYVRLRRLLGWSKSSQVTGISTRKDGNDQPITTLPELWRAIESQEVPMLWLQTAGMSPKSPKTQPQRQRPYSEHPILRLEAFLNELTDIHAKLASSLFALVQQNHIRSNDHIEDIEGLFAPVQKRNADAWARVEQVSKVFGDVKSSIRCTEARSLDWRPGSD